MNGIGHALGSGTRRMDDTFSADPGSLNRGRGIAQIASFNPSAVPLTHKNTVRVLCPPGKGILNAADRPDFRGAGGEQIAFHGKGPEYVNDDDQPVRLPGAFDQMVNPNFHIHYSARDQSGSERISRYFQVHDIIWKRSEQADRHQKDRPSGIALTAGRFPDMMKTERNDYQIL